MNARWRRAWMTAAAAVRPSAEPNSWEVGNLTLAGVMLGFVDLAFCICVLLLGENALHLDLDTLRTLTMVNLVFNGQAIYYVVRERRRIWSSMPSRIVLVCLLVDVLLVPGLAVFGILMAPLSPVVVASLFVGAIAFAVLLVEVKVVIFRDLNLQA
jgi:H+-transporting ATPase